MFLYGAGGHAKVIIDMLEKNNRTIEGIYDDNQSIDNLLGYPVLRAVDIKGPIIISIGNNNIRKTLAQSLNIEFEKAVDNTAIISPKTHIGQGSVILQGCVIQSCVYIANHCIINTGATVDHDCTIENYTHISPQATLCGNVHIKEGAWIGAGAIVLPGLKVGKWSIIGAGSIVTHDIPDNVIAYGNNCKIIKRIN